MGGMGGDRGINVYKCGYSLLVTKSRHLDEGTPLRATYRSHPAGRKFAVKVSHPRNAGRRRALVHRRPGGGRRHLWLLGGRRHRSTTRSPMARWASTLRRDPEPSGCRTTSCPSCPSCRSCASRRCRRRRRRDRRSCRRRRAAGGRRRRCWRRPPPPPPRTRRRRGRACRSLLPTPSSAASSSASSSASSARSKKKISPPPSSSSTTTTASARTEEEDPAAAARPPRLASASAWPAYSVVAPSSSSAGGLDYAYARPTPRDKENATAHTQSQLLEQLRAEKLRERSQQRRAEDARRRHSFIASESPLKSPLK